MAISWRSPASLRRRAHSQGPEAASAPRWSATERLRDEPEGAKTAPTSTTAAALSRTAQQGTQRADESGIGASLAAALACFGGCRGRGAGGARRRFTGPLDEAARPCAAAEALRQPLHVTGEQRGLDRVQHLRVSARLGERVEHDGDARH